MKILNNINAILVVPILSMVFLTSQAWADNTWSDQKAHHQSSGHQQASHHEQPIQHQQVPQYQNRPQPSEQRSTNQDRRHDQWNTHEHRIEVEGYVNTIPVPPDAVDYAAAPVVPTFIDSLPDQAVFVYIDGTKYAYFQGVFYKQIFSGYEAIDPATIVLGGSFNIAIPNTNGAYTLIQMNAVNNGFVGPQGEFYPQFPAIQQLQAMYIQ